MGADACIMTLTHRHKQNPGIVVTAWQFSLSAPVPVWVARVFHHLDGNRNEWSSVRSGDAVTGDWAVHMPTVSTSGPPIICALKDAAFRAEFEPLP